MTRELAQLAKDAGQRQQRRAILPELTMSMLRAAIEGEITREDVNDLYARYIAASSGVNPKSVDYADTGFKANASKMRQVVGLGVELRQRSMTVVDRALNMRVEIMNAGVKVHPEYVVLVNVARAQLLQPKKVLTKDQLYELIVRR
jgi:hypothetical protein